MRWLAFILAFTLPACSEALDNESDKCVYSDEMVVSKLERGGKVVQYDAKRMPAKQGRERVLSEHLRLSNGDEITIEQSYCDMYHYMLAYYLSGEKKPSSLGEILPTLDSLISKSYAGGYLTQSYSESVLGTLTMQQKTLQVPFSQWLPGRFTATSDNVEYSIHYKPLEKDKKFSAEFKVYISVGGL
jgi:hypothetical protein